MREPAAGGASGENIVDPAHGEPGPRPAVSAGIGVALLAIAALLLIEAQGLAPGAVRGVGPAAALRLVAVLVAVLGVVHIVAALRQRRAAGPVATVRGNHRALAWVLGALAGLMLILQFGGGFILASTWLFALTARGFGQPLGVRSIGIGLVLSTVVYLFFTKALSLALPGGPLERLLT